MLSFCGWVGLRGHLHDQSMALNLIDLLQHKNKLNLKQSYSNENKVQFVTGILLIIVKQEFFKALFSV